MLPAVPLAIIVAGEQEFSIYTATALQLWRLTLDVSAITFDLASW